MARLTAPDGRSRIPLLVTLAVIAVLAIGGGAFLLGRGSAPATTATSAAAPTPAASESVVYEGSYDPAPTGCLGGQERTPQMVLAAQKKAGHSAFGAVEVAAAIFRWSYRYPYPAADEVRAASSVFDPDTATKQMKAYLDAYAKSTYAQPLGGDVAEGTPYYLTTANGGWTVMSASSNDRVIATIQAHYVLGGSYSVTRIGSLTFVMTWVDDRWHLTQLNRSTKQAVASGGTAFTSGC